ncbi:MAG: sodium:proline symporter [Micavibrio sp.]|nr:sodium:proline symporter [Micavibrio sp.]|tara:strand:- start:432946 stop:434391 length:1446 start_codon:yes stop_codon:yes gene_type:complete
MSGVLIIFLLFLAVFLAIGLLSAFKRQKTSEDYLLASRDVPPSVVGLSAASSTASGFAFTGIVGFGYTMGFGGIWMMIATVIGGFLSVKLVSRPLRTHTQRLKTSCFTGFLTSSIEGKGVRGVRLLIALITLVAVVLYAAAQLTAGSKALNVLFGWHYDAGAIIGAVIVLLYCMAGGIRASIWTDVAQSFVMIGAIFAMLFACLSYVGGWGNLMGALSAIDPTLDNFWPSYAKGGAFAFIGGWFFLGVALVGFPHVMVRFMSLRHGKDANSATNWYFAGYGLFYLSAYMVAVCTRVILPPEVLFDKELALLETAEIVAPFYLVGLVLAGVFASTISTADSLILSGTASISQDIMRRQKDNYLFLKIVTFLVTAVALLIAIFGTKEVFSLVLLAVSIMGAAFAPIVFLRAFNQKIYAGEAYVMIVVALATVVIWRHFGWNTTIYEAMPGILSAFLIYILLRFIRPITCPQRKKTGKKKSVAK